jgi:hypothetical protein
LRENIPRRHIRENAHAIRKPQPSFIEIGMRPLLSVVLFWFHNLDQSDPPKGTKGDKENDGTIELSEKFP